MVALQARDGRGFVGAGNKSNFGLAEARVVRFMRFLFSREARTLPSFGRSFVPGSVWKCLHAAMVEYVYIIPYLHAVVGVCVH